MGVKLPDPSQELGAGELGDPLVGQDDGHVLVGRAHGLERLERPCGRTLAEDAVVARVPAPQLLPDPFEPVGLVVHDQEHGPPIRRRAGGDVLP
jgi:hypothetical protein